MSQGKTGGSKPVTTFVEADSTNFRDVVQRLTGQSISNVANEGLSSAQRIGKRPKPKLHERRQLYLESKLEIFKPLITHHQFIKPSTIILQQPPISSTSNPPNTEWQSLSPSFSSLPGLKQSRRESTLLFSDDLNAAEEENAIKERRFYLHPSPRSKPVGHIEPELLTLFPLKSPNTNHNTCAKFGIPEIGDGRYESDRGETFVEVDEVGLEAMRSYRGIEKRGIV
ncbi:VQ motif-containing protein 31 [Cornus florida]|uniref:VQ motif-containing protein 31 n=1 Tax=Cornus florida TaxID=4283 RepID=UPI00289F1DE9|nr:VQ motif-containing protein 31 [Cornus florida]